MSFSVDKLKSIVYSPTYRGFATGNKYDVIITPRNPASLTGVVANQLRDLRFLCDEYNSGKCKKTLDSYKKKQGFNKNKYRNSADMIPNKVSAFHINV